jgi:hypothetical protein
MCGDGAERYRVVPLGMGPIGCPETSVKTTTTRCVITKTSAVLSLAD